MPLPAVGGRAAWPKDFIFLRGAGTQAVGRAGGAAGTVFSRGRALLAGPLRALPLREPGGGVGGSRAHVDRYIVELCVHVL